MKKLLSVFIILSLAFSFKASSQQLIPDSIASKHATLQLKGKHFGFIWSLMPNKGTTEATNMLIQLRKQAGARFDTAQIFTVQVSYNLVANMYYVIGSQQERLASVDNAEIKDALIPQLMVPQYMDLLQAIGGIGALNKSQTEQIRADGIKQIMAITVN